MFRPSIRLRLLLWFGLLVLALAAGFGATAYQLQKRAAMDEIDAELASRVEAVGAAFRSEMFGSRHGPRDHGEPPSNFKGLPPLPVVRPPFDRPRMRPFARTPLTLPAAVTNQFDEISGCYFAIRGDEGTVLAQSPAGAATLAWPAPAGAGTAIRHRTRGVCREAYHFTEMRDCVLVGCDIAADLARLRRFAWGLAGAGALVLLLGLGGGWFFAGLALRSVRRIGAAARRISEGALSERIPAARMDRELGELADVLNATFARLDAAFARQQQFTADAAHELRTPLAVILTETQTALRRDRPPGEYRDTLRACEEAAQKMRRLAESLLELARLDAGPDRGERVATDLALLAQESLEPLRPLAEQRDIRIQTDLKPAEIACRPDQIGRVFVNLLTNALDHTPPGGTIRVSTAVENGEVLAIVADTGEGIAPEDLPHVFDRFYRACRTRSRAEGHAGLGLAICKGIMDAHGGRIDVASTPGRGAVFTLRCPAPSRSG